MRPTPAAVLGCLAFVLIGFSGLLVPSLIRSIKDTFDQSDAGIGVSYLLYATAYASGSFGGGLVTERAGRRIILPLAAGLDGLGLVILGIAPTWPIFLVAALPAGIGAGGIDGGVNGLILDLYPTGRGRALNLVHLFFSAGALGAPLVVGQLVEAGVAWGLILATAGLALLLLGVLFRLVAMPDGRRSRDPHARREVGSSGLRWRGRLAAPLALLAIAIGCYVASEVGLSSWLVAYLGSAPITVATAALSLFWAGLTVGRLISARIADRFDHVRFAATAATAAGAFLVGAIVAPLPVSIVLFFLVGAAMGPVYPMIMAIGGDRYPDRVAAVSGSLGAAAVAGSIVYPPLMGFLSVTVGLTVAMAGAALLALACAGALVVVGTIPARMGHEVGGSSVRSADEARSR